MQVQITQHGTLSITPYTELEAFALEAWFRRYTNNDDACILEIKSLDGISSLISPNKREKEKVLETVIKEVGLVASKNTNSSKSNRKNPIKSKRELAEDVIFKLLASNREGLLATEIESKTKLKDKTVYNALNKLFKSKKLDKDKSGKYITWRTGTGKLIEAKKPEYKDTHRPFKDYRDER